MSPYRTKSIAEALGDGPPCNKGGHYRRLHRCPVPGWWRTFFDAIETGDVWVCHACKAEYVMSGEYPKTWVIQKLSGAKPGSS